MKYPRVGLAILLMCGAWLPSGGASGQTAPPADSTPEGLSPGDWSGIRAAYEASRHSAFPVEGGHQARNPGQQWLTRFDGQGFTTEPDAGDWTWGLELESYGFAGEERAVEEPMGVRADGQRVAYQWDRVLEEWYLNDQRGLEHGYTVRERPSLDGEGPLTLTLAVRGALRPQVQQDGYGVSFVNEAGMALLTYSGLTVLDADGRRVPARLAHQGKGLRVIVDERGARYPLTIDPVAQQAYLKASNTEASDLFGASVAVSGDTVVVGAYGEDSSATGVNGNQSDNSLSWSGAAYVFVRNGTSWSQQAYLKASNPDSLDQFGISVAISGDTVVVATPNEASNAMGVDGDQGDNSAGYAGAVYVFARSGTTWSQQAYLKASNTDPSDHFGASISISGDTVVVGATGEESNATGVSGDQRDNSANGAGAVYVFTRSGTTWSQQAYLKASNTDPWDFFGESVSVSADTVVVGAIGESSSATGVDGNQGDNGALDSGAAYVFVRSGTTWSQQAYLKASATGVADAFGNSASVSGDTIVVGAYREDSSATGVDGDQSDNGADWSGAAYVFARSGTTWSQQAYLKASNTDPDDSFGWAVATSGDTVVVSAPTEQSNAAGVNGNQGDNSSNDSGAVYVFVRSGATWHQQAYLKASNTGAFDGFGVSVSISGDTVIVGAIYEDSRATGVNGDQSDDSLMAAGAAYIFHVEDPWVDLGLGLAGTGGLTPQLSGTGTLLPSTPLGLTLGNALPDSLAWLFIGGSRHDHPFRGGVLVPSHELIIPAQLVDGSGEIIIASTMPAVGVSGQTYYFQYWVVDPGAPFGLSASNAIRGTAP